MARGLEVAYIGVLKELPMISFDLDEIIRAALMVYGELGFDRFLEDVEHEIPQLRGILDRHIRDETSYMWNGSMKRTVSISPVGMMH